MRWQIAFQPVEIEIGVQIGQDGVLRPEFADPFQRFGQGKMARMRRIAQRIDNPEVEILEKLPAFGRDRIEIGRIGNVCEAKAERVDFAVFEPERQELDLPPGPSMPQISPGMSRFSLSSAGYWLPSGVSKI